LSKRISGLELEQRFVPFLEDFPIVAQECSEDCDFVFAFALVEEDEDTKLIKEKLIDVELKSSVRIFKAIEEDSFSGLDEEDFLESKNELVEKYCDVIVSILFNERAFEPEEKDFGL
jgi:riboflavin synthase